MPPTPTGIGGVVVALADVRPDAETGDNVTGDAGQEPGSPGKVTAEDPRTRQQAEEKQAIEAQWPAREKVHVQGKGFFEVKEFYR